MKTKMYFIVLFFALVLNLTAQQQGDYSSEPGYFDFGEITSLKSGDMITEVYLEEQLLKMVAKMGESKGEELGDLINGLKLVKVNEFLVEGKNAKIIEDAFASFDKNLQSKKWNRIVKTKHKQGNAYVYVKNNSDDTFAGLVIAALDKENKVTLVNIVGNIDPEAIGKLSRQFNFPNVDKMKSGEKEEK